MNICLISPTFLPKLGGVEIVVSSLASSLVQSGHNVIIVTQWPRKGRGLPQDDLLNYPVIRYKRPISFLWSLGLRGIQKSLTRAYQNLPFDVIHCHLAFPVGPVALNFAKKQNIPVVITTHGSDIRQDSRYRARQSIWKKICQSLNEANAVTAISQEMESLLKPIMTKNTQKITLIPNAVDIQELTKPTPHDPAWPITKNEKFILYLGGLTHKKGVNVLLDAIKSLNFKNQKLIIAGDGPDRRQLEQKQNQCIQFVGKVQGPLKNYLLQNCRYVIMPSLTEGFGLVALEAFSCGKPLIASSVGGLKELMQKNKFLGLTTTPADATELAKTITQMESTLDSYDPTQIQNFAKQYDWPIITKKYIDLYKSIVINPLS